MVAANESLELEKGSCMCVILLSPRGRGQAALQYPSLPPPPPPPPIPGCAQLIDISGMCVCVCAVCIIGLPHVRAHLGTRSWFQRES